eukprot:14382567-Ditylum_brightwellii.AAC.1
MKALCPVVKIGKQSGLCNIKPKGLSGWPVNVIQALLNMLSHHTPLVCISANMLMITEIFFPEGQVVELLLGKSFLQECRGTLAVLTKTLAAYQVAGADKVDKHHSDATKQCGISIHNSTLLIQNREGVRKHQTAKEKGMNKDDIKLSKDLKDDLDNFHFTLRVQTKVGNIYRTVEKENAETAQYAKGDDTMFYGWKKTHHPTTYIYSCARALGGARQDL